MSSPISKFQAEINKLLASCNRQVFRSKESLKEVLALYEQLRNLKVRVLADCPSFEAETLDGIILDIQQTFDDKSVSRKKIEWIFFHYTDLLVFKVEHFILNLKVCY